ncbi:ribosome-associated translation inhibitor RaiA [Brachybacterium sp. JHP9]|uniref:Ribosome hibernation promoting factor n=1 Tax=Brachybacterium equifaecis TaxID=2910770 RepID=A0ABT0R3F0_9MICO|nr:ribosome-associated translation inhibitor RaiA [Brachybacterium equifaecis]MCL6423938.1 ribosome-associated translation inhibitor RaiA [Brachybacterium equifaecis]
MEINVVGRHMDVPERFRRHLEEKLEKISQLAPQAQRVDVELSEESNPRQSDSAARVELTVHDDGAVIRSEARADDLYGALDVAHGKLLERLRRARDRRKDRGRGRSRSHQDIPSVRTMAPLGEGIEAGSVPGASAPSDQGPAEPGLSDPEQTDPLGGADRAAGEASEEGGDEAGDAFADSPVVIREKKHRAQPMSIDDALYRMEQVGHDFFLFVDEATGNPKVVYRRKGWNYGVIELEQAAGGTA